MISSRSIDELRALLSPVIGEHGLPVDPRHAGTFFEQLRLLSGRLAFKLASAAANQRTEVLGPGARPAVPGLPGSARPTRSWCRWTTTWSCTGTRGKRRVGGRRRCLACSAPTWRCGAWTLGAAEITCRLVEVKCYSAVRGGSGFEPAPGADRGAAEHAASRCSRAHFDPAAGIADRPDRAVRNAELAGLLRFYLGRAVRHDVMRDDAAAEAEWMLGNLDSGGYRLRFTQTGLIFDLSADRDRLVVPKSGVEYHRIGRDLIEELLDALPTDPVLAAKGDGPSASTLDVSLPKLADAAFRAPDRSHETPDGTRV